MKWILSLVGFCFFVSAASSQEIGQVKYIVSQVTLVRGVSADVAAPGEPLHLNDIVRTGQSGRARLVLLDGSELTLGPQTELRVVVANPDAQQTTVEMLYGRLRAHVTSVTKQGGIFQVRTPVGIAVALGTELEVDTVLAPGAGTLIEAAAGGTTDNSARADLKISGETKQKKQRPPASPALHAVQVEQLTDHAADVVLAWQLGRGSISGSLSDRQGTVLSNVTVSATNWGTGAVLTTASDSSGSFRLDTVPSGNYTLTYQAPGLQPYRIPNLTVGSGWATNVGQVKLSVSGGADVTGVQSSAPSSVITQPQVTHSFSGVLPSTDFRLSQNLAVGSFALRFPGITSGGSSTFLNGGPGLFLSNPEFVQQYVLVTNNFGPEYARNSGSAVNIIIKPGANSWNGNLYPIDSNLFKAFTSPQAGHSADSPTYVSVDFDKIFRSTSEQDLSYFASLFRALWMDVEAAPKSSLAADSFANPNFASDWSLTKKFQLGADTITSRYLFNRGFNFNFGESGSQGFLFNPSALSQSLLESWTHNFSAPMVNEARVSFNRLSVDFGGTTPSGSSQIGQNFIFTPPLNLTVLPTSPRSSTFPFGRTVNTWQPSNNWNYLGGRKNLLRAGYARYAGFEFGTGLSSNFDSQENSWGNTQFGAGLVLTPNFQPGFVSARTGINGPISTHWSTPVTNKLLLETGLFSSGAHWADERFDASTAYLGSSSFSTLPNRYSTNFGFAYSPQWGGFLTGHGKTAFRGGYRMLYDPPFYNIYVNNSTSQFPISALITPPGNTNTTYLDFDLNRIDRPNIYFGAEWSLLDELTSDFTNFGDPDRPLYQNSAGGNFNALAPFTGRFPVSTPAPAPLVSLSQIPAGSSPGASAGPNLTNFEPVISMNVTAFDHYIDVGSWSPKTNWVFGMPGQMITVDRGKPPSVPISIFDSNASNHELKYGAAYRTASIEDFDSMGNQCVPNIVVNGVSQNPEAAGTFTYTVSGNNVSTGQTALKLDVTNSSACTLFFFTKFDTVFHPSSTAHQVGAVASILLGGNLNVNDVKSYQDEGSVGGLLIVPPAQNPLPPKSSKSGPSASPEDDSDAGSPPESTPGTASMFLRSYCLELHKLAPHTNTHYKFADDDLQQKYGSTGSIISRLFEKVQSRELEIPKGHTLDSLIQWALWMSREGMDEKKFKEAYQTLVHHNYESQKKKWDKDAQRMVEDAADSLWLTLQKASVGS